MEIAVSDMPTRRGANLLCNVFGFYTFSNAYADRLSSLTVAALASGPESKPAEERNEGKRNLARERVLGSIDSVCPRVSAIARVSLCVCLYAGACGCDAACTRALVRVYCNMPCHGYTRNAHAARACLCGERTGDFSACSSHEWAPRRVGFTDTSATPLRSDVLLLPVIDFADAWRHRRSVIAAGR